MNYRILLRVALTLATGGFPCFAAEESTGETGGIPNLVVGSPAPALKVAKWIQGEPVTNFENGRIYVIECWATSSASSIIAISHVNALHEAFKDKGVVVIGVNVQEASASRAESFVKKKGADMSYRVAFDGGEDGDTARHWLKDAGVGKIPHAFVVKDGKILWQGHPSDLTEEMVSEILAGKFDPEKAQAAADKEKLGEELGELHEKFGALIEDHQAEEAKKVLDHQVAIASKVIPAALVDIMQREGLLDIALVKGDAKAVAVLLREYADAGAKLEGDEGSDALFTVASRIITDERLTGARDYGFALICLDRLLARPHEEMGDSEIAHMRARALEATGKKDEAIKILTKLASLAEDADEIRAELAALMAGKPWPKGEMNPDEDRPGSGSQ